MENTELLERLLAVMEQNQEQLRKEIREGLESQKRDLIQQFTAAMDEQSEMLIKMMDQKVSEAETRVNIKIEHEVDSKLKALFDGYMSSHEKQWELERHTDRLQNQVDSLETRIEVLESKTA